MRVGLVGSEMCIRDSTHTHTHTHTRTHAHTHKPHTHTQTIHTYTLSQHVDNHTNKNSGLINGKRNTTLIPPPRPSTPPTPDPDPQSTFSAVFLFFPSPPQQSLHANNVNACLFADKPSPNTSKQPRPSSLLYHPSLARVSCTPPVSYTHLTLPTRR